MALPSYESADGKDDNKKCPSSPNLMSKPGELSQDKLMALLKSFNIEVNIKNKDGSESKHDNIKSFPTNPSQNWWTNVIPSTFAAPNKLQSGLRLCTTSCSGNNLENMKVVISKAQCMLYHSEQTKTTKIVTTALSPAIAGHDKLPSDIITQILNGMSSASTKVFCSACNTQIAMMTNS
jgi:hypothetical protein